jgi:F-type H+-transporting ATPase subunit epsilon
VAENKMNQSNKQILLEVVTPTKIELVKQVDYLVAPTIDGMIGILPGHIRLMTQLDTGVLTYKVNGETFYMAVSEGYMEVTPHKVIILAEAAELPEHIDVERALNDKRRAEEELYRPMEEKISFARTQVSLQRALTRLQVVKKYGDKKE